MSNIDNYKEYIQDSIINHLERLMGNNEVDDVNLWVKYGSKGLVPQKDSVYRSMLHAMMVPFNVSYLTAFSVIIREPDESSLPKLAQADGNAIPIDNQEVINGLFQDFPELAQILPKQLGAVLRVCEKETSLADIMIALSATSRRSFVRKVINPVLTANLIKNTYPDNPRHPQQKYYITELGLKVLKLLNEE